MFVVALFAALSAVAPPPDQAEARLRAAQTALGARDYDTAAREFQAVLAAAPRNAAAHINLGIIALIQGNAALGLTHFSAVPDSPRALIGRLDCELRLGKRAEARGTASRLESMTASDTRGSQHIGTLLASAEEYVAAVPFLRRVEGAAAAHLLGAAEEKAGNMPAAVEAFGKAARLEPANLEYRIDYAAVLLSSGAIADSVSEFRSADEQFPRSPRVKLGLGSALYLAGHYEEAARVLLEAVRLDRQPRSFDLLGRAYEAAGPLQPEIRAEFENYLKTSPQDAVAYAHFAAFAHSSGAPPGVARRSLARALELQPDLAAAHLQLGILQQTAGEWQAALQSLRRAAELDSENAAIRYRLAGVYSKLGRTEQAQAALREFQRLKAREARTNARP